MTAYSWTVFWIMIIFAYIVLTGKPREDVFTEKERDLEELEDRHMEVVRKYLKYRKVYLHELLESGIHGKVKAKMKLVALEQIYRLHLRLYDANRKLRNAG